ncbi:MAG TPA: glycosyltransferase family 2 protein [Anaerolineae bacterium]|nr:glycosyltransferase family 2 protein [Anaerolineae bacterium]
MGLPVDVSVIIASWNTRELLRQCLQSIMDEPGVQIVAADAAHWPPEQTSGVTVEVVVVDNASDDGSAQMVQAAFPQAHLIANRYNAGFAAANNQAIAQASGQVLLLLNPDAYLLPGALTGLARFLRDHPEAAVAGPNVLNPDGSWQAAAFRFATLWDLFCEAVFLSVLWPRSPLFARKELGGFDRDTMREVEWVQGCALAIRREVWDAVGPFDEGYWMYVEELDWCRRAKGMGYRIFFTPDAQVVHYGKRSVARARASVLPLGFRSHFRYYRKFDGRAKELAVRLIALLQMGLRAAISVVMLLATRGVAQARWRENWRAYTGVMREAVAVWR